MRDIYRFIKLTLKPDKNQYYDEYVKKMDNLMENLEPYFPSGKNAVYPPISEQDYKKIDKIFDEAAKASNDFIHSYDNIVEPFDPKRPPIQDVAINLNNEFFSKAYVEYKNIKPNPHFSLKDQMEDFRYVNVQMTSNEIKKLGAAQSSRIQMSVNIDGKNVKGVFTNMTHLNGKPNIEAIFPRMIEKYPKYAEFFKSIDVNEFYNKGVKNISDKAFYDKNGNAYAVGGDNEKAAFNAFLNNGSFSQDTMREANKFINEEDFHYACLDFITEVDKQRVPIVLNRDVCGMKEGDRIDVKNSAMSAVATLIKCPDVIAKSRPLVIYDDKGHKYQEGTFMEYANGKDINNLAVVDEMRLMKPSDFESPDVKQQLANLQVLDYICGNIDRHSGNMLYQVDPKTRKLTGIVGIDNDCAFIKKDLGVNDYRVRLPGINYLRVIDEDMANTIKNLDEGQLKATLHGYGLDKEAIDAAWKRTVQLKTVINNGHQYSENNAVLQVNPQNPTITIMKKEDWAKVNTSECYMGLDNYFNQFRGVAQTTQLSEGIDPRLRNRKNSALAGLNASLGKTQSSYLLKKAKDASPWFGTSNRYKNILGKLKEYNDTPLANESNPLSSDNDNKYLKLYEMKQAIDVYKMEKMSDGYIDENWNIKRDLSGKDLDRVLTVKSMEDYVNRVEQERQLAEQAKKAYDDNVKFDQDVKKFLMKDDNKKQQLVNDKINEELANKKKEDDLIVTSSVSSDIYNNNIFINDNAFIKKEEVELDNNKEVVKEDNKEVIKDLDLENEL